MNKSTTSIKFGESVQRFEDDRFLKGDGRYVSDIPSGNQVYAKIFRSPYAAGNISDFDTTKASSIQGVLAILTGADAERDGIGSIKAFMSRNKADGSPNFEPNYSILPKSSVHHIGEALAIVIAKDEETANTACELIHIKVNESKAVTSVSAALEKGAPAVWDQEPSNICFVEQLGNPQETKKAFSKARHIIEDEFTISRVIAAPMETRSAIGYYDKKNKRYLLKTGSQVPHLIQGELAKNALKINPNNLQIISPDVGGGFGLKASAQREMALVLWASKRLDRPIRWIADRSDSFLGDHHARDNKAKVALSLDSEGYFLGLRVSLNCAIGAFIDSFALHIMVGNAGGLAGPYKIKNFDVKIKGIFTNTQPIAPYRGAGRPEATYCIERIINIAAHRLGISPIELRRKNMISSDLMPYNTGLTFKYDSGDFQEVMNSAIAFSDADGFPKRRKDANKRGRLSGQGIAYAVEIANGPQDMPGHEVARINFEQNGDAQIIVGSHNHGQGHETAFRQLAGEFLGLMPNKVKIEFGNTDLISDGIGTFGSRSAATCGTAIRSASVSIIEQGKKLASDIFETAVEDIEFKNGTFLVRGTDKNIDIHKLAEDTLGLVGKNIKPQEFSAFSKDAPDNCTFPNACHICEVEIDRETGFIELTRYHLADDVGNVLNPLLLQGQFHGGVVQGIGQALFEEIVFEPKSGQILTGSFMDYCLPRADNLPFINLIGHNVPSPNTLFGIKGAGEAGTVGSIVAVMNAVADALSEVGAELPQMPTTPERLWRAINNRKK